MTSRAALYAHLADRPDDEIGVLAVPPYPRTIITLLRQRDHVVAVRRNRNGSLRYRIDGGREVDAATMDRFYTRKYRD